MDTPLLPPTLGEMLRREERQHRAGMLVKESSALVALATKYGRSEMLRIVRGVCGEWKRLVELIDTLRDDPQ